MCQIPACAAVPGARLRLPKEEYRGEKVSIVEESIVEEILLSASSISFPFPHLSPDSSVLLSFLIIT